MVHTLVEQAWTFCRAHWVHGILLIPGAVTFTVFHELAHCIAVWAQGGTVTEFVWLPSGENWGHMAYSFHLGGSFNQAWVSLSPYGFWLLSVLLVYLASFLRKTWPFWLGSTLYVWLVVAPLADFLNAAWPYVMFDADNDLASAFGPAGWGEVMGVAFIGLCCLWAGYVIQRNLYAERSLGQGPYLLLAGAVVGGVALVSSGV